jgi:tripartite-type tricarboxylate transporter receptor subunit TctC
MARLIAKAAEKELGQPIVCENRPGAGGVLGTAFVLKSKPDGYTIGVTSTNAFLNSPHMEKVPYDPLTDSTDIMAFLKTTHALCVRTDSPWKSFEDVVAYARKNPGAFIYANGGGVGSTQHIVMERIAMKEGIKWSMVPFKSGTESVLACLGGHTQGIAASGPADVVQHIAAGKLKVLLALNDNRWQIAPDIPTVQEKYGFYGMSCQGVYGPKGLPENIREKLQNGFKKAMNDPDFVDGAKRFQMVVVYMGGKEYEKWWKSQYEVMGKVIRDLGLGKKI